MTAIKNSWGLKWRYCCLECMWVGINQLISRSPEAHCTMSNNETHTWQRPGKNFSCISIWRADFAWISLYLRNLRRSQCISWVKFSTNKERFCMDFYLFIYFWSRSMFISYTQLLGDNFTICIFIVNCILNNLRITEGWTSNRFFMPAR